MTPVAHGWEADYYRASRAARAAFDRTDEQLSIGALEEELEQDASALPAEATPGSSSSAPFVLPPDVGALGSLPPLSKEDGR